MFIVVRSTWLILFLWNPWTCVTPFENFTQPQQRYLSWCDSFINPFGNTQKHYPRKKVFIHNSGEILNRQHIAISSIIFDSNFTPMWSNPFQRDNPPTTSKWQPVVIHCTELTSRRRKFISDKVGYFPFDTQSFYFK